MVSIEVPVFFDRRDYFKNDRLRKGDDDDVALVLAVERVTHRQHNMKVTFFSNHSGIKSYMVFTRKDDSVFRKI